MKTRNDLFKNIIKQLASLKLAVFVIIALATIVSVGTIIESKYDATAASKWVYRSWYMRAILNLLIINLLAVMIDRWPWKQRHAPFVMAHIGIIVLLFGAWVSITFGLDGTMRVAIGDKGHAVTIPETEMTVYSSFDGLSFTKLNQQNVDFFLHPPEKEPVRFPIDKSTIEVVHYEPYVLPTHKVSASDSPQAGPGVRFQLMNSRANFSEWMVQRTGGEPIVKDLGPAQVTLTTADKMPKANTGRNEVFFASAPPAKGAPIVGSKAAQKTEPKLLYFVSYKEPSRKPLHGEMTEGQVVQTGWMGLELRLLRYFPHAQEGWDFEPVDHPSENTTSAIEIRFNGTTHWLQLDDVVKFFTDNAVYVVSYAHRRVETGFTLLLKKFAVGRYQGTNTPSSYESLVEVPDVGEKLISMNEPLKYNGLTVYQASFQQDDKGEPIASVFSVNYDPGRWLKYLGSLIIVLGVVLLFFNRRKTARHMGPHADASPNDVPPAGGQV